MVATILNEESEHEPYIEERFSELTKMKVDLQKFH